MKNRTQSKPSGVSGRVAGHLLSAPRPTIWAVLYALLYAAVPLLLLLLAVDLVIYLVVTHVFDRCYGIACLFG